MKPINRYYEVTPRVVRADRESEVVIRPLFDHVRFVPGKAYTVQHFLMEDSPLAPRSALAGTFTVKPDRAGRLRFRSRFTGEQEHWIHVAPPPGESGPPPADLHLFSLREDLFSRRPLKGDFHLHTNRSDGRESPAYVAAACRRIGYDFMAITDHHRYGPSLEAIQAFAGIAHDLQIFPGEEVHPPDVPVHMVNFAGDFSVNELFRQPAYAREVKRLAARIARSCAPGVDPAHAAACAWSCRKVRQGGGLPIFCHPHWIAGLTYNVAEPLNEWMFANRIFDAFELIGGYNRSQVESNQLQVAWYHEQRLKRPLIPIVGASDAHGCETGELFGWYYTIVFAPSASREDILGGVRAGYSVAIEALPGAEIRPHGPYRLVKYALFLAREVLPAHDELCAEEGRLMARHAAGDTRAGAALRRLNGRCAHLQARQFGLAPSR